MTQLCPSINQWHQDVPRQTRSLMILGFAILGAWLFGFCIWALLAPIASAVVASGSFVATGQNKQMQHLEGGIIREMFVKEGDMVEAGQPVVSLDDTAALSKLRRLLVKKSRLIASRARLQAEIHALPQLQIPAELAKEMSDPSVLAIVRAQEAELAARRGSLLAQEEVLRREIAGLQESIQGFESQVSSNHSRRKLFDEELKAKTPLLEQQLIRRSEVIALQRSQASLSGELGEFQAKIGDAKERIARAEKQILQLRTSALQKATEELHATDSELDDVREQILAAQDVVARTEVRAPVRGIVVKLNQHTQGGVIGPGGVILELLPINDELVIEARVNPNEITHVAEGQRALVRLTALNQRLTPMIEGTVIYVSADTVSEQSGRRANESDAAKRDSFVVRARLDENDVRKKTENFRPTPGMPADVYIQTGERTFLTYLMRPVLDSFSRAFREH